METGKHLHLSLLGESWQGESGSALKSHCPGRATFSFLLLSLDDPDANRKPSLIANAYFRVL